MSKQFPMSLEFATAIRHRVQKLPRDPVHEFNVGGLRRAGRDVALDRRDRREPGVGDVARRLLGLLNRVVETSCPAVMISVFALMLASARR